MNRSAAPKRGPWGWLSRFFSPRIEESLRLRVLTLASLWLAALSLAWVGGDLRMSLAGGVLGTPGYWLGWRWRHRTSLVRPLLIAGLVVALSLLMRSRMVAVFSGDWLPMGYFLVLVQAAASFDSRTRGGLYAGLVLSGSVLFFASQQAFQPGFVVFVVGIVVVLLAFLTVAFLEDGIRGAHVRWPRGRPARAVMLPYWLGVASTVFLLAGLAFWLMPRGEVNLTGSPRVSVLPYSGNSLDGERALPQISLEDIVPARMLDEAGQQLLQEMPDADPGRGLDAPGSGLPADGPPGPATDQMALPPAVGEDAPARTAGDVPGVEPERNSGGGAVFYVRTKVMSYWRGRTLERFDGGSWHTDAAGADSHLVPSATREGVWYDRDGLGRENGTVYHQTFYVQRDQPGAVFAGYQPISIAAVDGALDGAALHRGDAYRVLSAYPQHTPERLKRDYTWVAGAHLTAVPPESAQTLSLLAGRITEGARTDFEKMERIVAYLSQRAALDPGAPGDLTASAGLEGFLLGKEPGTAMDFATGTVMLARASGLPARLALGYLPGVRDPLSGAYRVRQRDAHAWAEVYFADAGWVPFDSAPRMGLALDGRARSGFLLRGGVGDDLYGAVKSAPGQLAGPVLEAMRNPVFSLMAPALLLAGLFWRWLCTRPKRRRASPGPPLAYNAGLSGEGRRELLKLYRRLEGMLRRRSGVRRRPWQTVGDYTRAAGGSHPIVQRQLAWFTQAVWHAAYDPTQPPAGLVAEARRRLAVLRASLKSATRTASLRRR